MQLWVSPAQEDPSWNSWSHITPVPPRPRRPARAWWCGRAVCSRPAWPAPPCRAARPRLARGRWSRARRGHTSHQQGSSSAGHAWQRRSAAWPRWGRGPRRFSSGWGWDRWAPPAPRRSRLSSPGCLLPPPGPCRNSGSLQQEKEGQLAEHPEVQ